MMPPIRSARHAAVVLARSVPWLRAWMAALAVLTWLLAIGCGPAESVEGDWPLLYGADPHDDPAPPVCPATPAAADLGVLGHTEAGRLVLFSAEDGERLVMEAGMPTAAEGRAALSGDLAYDRSRDQAIRIWSRPHARAAEVVGFGLRRGTDGVIGFHRRWRWGLAAHGTRSWPLEAGLMMFEPAPAPRWRWIDDDGITRAVILAEAPLAAWSPAEASASTVHALVPPLAPGRRSGRGGVALARASVSEQGRAELVLEELEPGEQAIGDDARATRWRPLAVEREGSGHTDDVVIVDERDGRIRVWWRTGGRLGPPIELPVDRPVGHPLDVAVVHAPSPAKRWCHERPSLAIVADGGWLLVAHLGADQAFDRVDEVELSGSPSAAALSGRLLQALPRGRLLVASSEGVEAFEVIRPASSGVRAGWSGTRPVREFDGSGLRGPLAGPVPLNP